MKVSICDIKTDAGEELCQQLSKQSKDRVIFCVCDVTDYPQFEGISKIRMHLFNIKLLLRIILIIKQDSIVTLSLKKQYCFGVIGYDFVFVIIIIIYKI